MRRKRMAQGMGTDPVLETGSPGRIHQHLPGSAPVQALSSHGHEQRPTVSAVPAMTVSLGQEMWPSLGHVAAQPDYRHLTHGDLSLTIALADAPDEPTLEVDLVAVKTHGLRDPEPGGVQQLQERPISNLTR